MLFQPGYEKLGERLKGTNKLDQVCEQMLARLYQAVVGKLPDEQIREMKPLEGLLLCTCWSIALRTATAFSPPRRLRRLTYIRNWPAWTHTSPR